MNHVDEGLFLAVRDGEPVDDDSRAHVRTCVSCRHALAEAEARSQEIDALLKASDLPVPVEQAKARVRARLDAERSRGERRLDRGRHLRRAAAILVVSAGAAYALPGSPLPGWLGMEEDGTDAAAFVEPIEGGDEEQELLLVPAGNGIDSVVWRAAAGGDIEVVWREGASARSSAGPGARYAISDGRAIATAAGGPIRIGVPRSAPRISITINGRMVYEGTGTDGEARDVVSRSDDRIVFLASEP